MEGMQIQMAGKRYVRRSIHRKRARGSRESQQGLLEEETSCARLEAVGTRTNSSWDSVGKKETDGDTQTRGK